MKIYFNGQTNFGNHGCEALIRSAIHVIEEKYPGSEYLVPSVDPGKDKLFIKDLNVNVHLFKYTPPRYMNRIYNILRVYNHYASLIIPNIVKKMIDGSDIVISIGGDNYSLDYGYPNVVYSADRYAIKKGKSVFLWGASVGPFSKDPYFESKMISHFKKFKTLFIREGESELYLKNFGVIDNVVPVSDSAFLMKKSDMYVPKSNGSIGFNLSPIIANKANTDVIKEAVNFITHLVELDQSVTLIPHVNPYTGGDRNNDYILLNRIYDLLDEVTKEHVYLLNDELNAIELKAEIGCCKMLIAARTHATIAGFSQKVPTISIAYSVKAIGINKDVFNSTEYILAGEEYSAKNLISMYESIEKSRDKIADLYDQAIPRIKAKAEKPKNFI